MVTLTEQAQIDFRCSTAKTLHPPDERIQALEAQGFKDLKEYQDSWYEEWCHHYDTFQSGSGIQFRLVGDV